MPDSRELHARRLERPNRGRYLRVLDLHALPDFEHGLEPEMHDRALVCMADPAARKILRRLAEAPASERQLQTEEVQDREKLSLRLYRLLNYRLIRVVGRDPNVFALDRETMAVILARLAAEFGPLPDAPSTSESSVAPFRRHESETRILQAEGAERESGS